MKRKRSEMGFDTEEFQRPAKRPRLDNDNHQPEVDPQEMFAQSAFSYHTGCGSTDSQADGQEKSHVIQPARETRPGPTDCQTSSYPQIQSESKQETIEKNPVNLSQVETWFDSTDIRTSKYLLSDQTATPEVGDVTPSDTLDHLLSLINEYLYETTPVPSASSVIQKLTEPVNDANLVQIAAATDEYSRSPTTDGLHSLLQTASSASALLASVDGDRSQSRNVEHDLPSCSGSVIKSHSGTVQTTSTDSELQSEYGSIRHKKVPRRRSSNESESKTRANFERVSRTHFSEKDTTRKSASRKREHEKDASYESAPRKRSSEKRASQKQSSTKNATRKRRFSRSKSPDNALERTQHKKAKCGTSSCEGQKAKVKDSERSRHAQFVKNQGTSQDPQRQPFYTSLIANWKEQLNEWNAKNREINSKDAHKMKYPSHLHEWLERVKFNHTRKWKMLHYEKPKWTPQQLALTSKSQPAGKA